MNGTQLSTPRISDGESTQPPRRGEIYRLIPAVMRIVGAVEKGRKNQQQGYAFRGIDDLYNAMQQPMAEAGIFCVPSVIRRQREERATKDGKGVLIYTTLTVRHTFYAPDGSSVDAVTIGEAMDSGDKSSNKAMSAAMKYALIEVFCIPTADPKDPEDDSPRPLPRQQPQRRPESPPVNRLSPEDEEFVNQWQHTYADRGFPVDKADWLLASLLNQKKKTLNQIDGVGRQRLLEMAKTGHYDAYLRPPQKQQPAAPETDGGQGRADEGSVPPAPAPSPAADDAPPVDVVAEALEQPEYPTTLRNRLADKLGVSVGLASKAIEGWANGDPGSVTLDERRRLWDAIEAGTAQVSRMGTLRIG